VERVKTKRPSEKGIFILVPHIKRTKYRVDTYISARIKYK